MMKSGVAIWIILLGFAMGIVGGFVLPATLAGGAFMAIPLVVLAIGVACFLLLRRFFFYLEDVDQRKDEGLILRSAAENIYVLRKLSLIKSLLPSDSTYYEKFHKERGIWRFIFHSHSSIQDFEATGIGQTPRSALNEAEKSLRQQIKMWNSELLRLRPETRL